MPRQYNQAELAKINEMWSHLFYTKDMDVDFRGMYQNGTPFQIINKDYKILQKDGEWYLYNKRNQRLYDHYFNYYENGIYHDRWRDTITEVSQGDYIDVESKDVTDEPPEPPKPPEPTPEPDKAPEPEVNPAQEPSAEPKKRKYKAKRGPRLKDKITDHPEKPEEVPLNDKAVDKATTAANETTDNVVEETVEQVGKGTEQKAASTTEKIVEEGTEKAAKSAGKAAEKTSEEATKQVAANGMKKMSLSGKGKAGIIIAVAAGLALGINESHKDKKHSKEIKEKKRKNPMYHSLDYGDTYMMDDGGAGDVAKTISSYRYGKHLN